MTGIPFTEREVTELRLGTMTRFSRPIPVYVDPSKGVINVFVDGKYVWKITNAMGHDVIIQCPYKVFTKYFVKETWRVRGGKEYEYQKHQPSVVYEETETPQDRFQQEWNTALSMKFWASRFQLEIQAIYAIRLHNITSGQAKEHGCYGLQEFRDEWDCRYKGKGAEWKNNPFVWMNTFKVL